jgi:uncharacterized membrane protein
MYIDVVIVMSLFVIVVMIVMMVYLYRYANRHIIIDETEAKKTSSTDDIPLYRDN